MHKLLVLCTLAIACSAAQVSLNGTILVGREISSYDQEFFGGIPFAQPPTGNLRFAPPVPATLNVSTFDASQFGLECPQLTGNYSEDCLTINILRPAGLTPTSGLPVLTWVFGGGFVQGDGSTWNGSAIVAQSVSRNTPVIYVNFNYRLGPFGFPQGAEATAKNSLNLGLKDQLLALEWIQQNIVSFGGDPSKVTVWGASAGSISLAILVLDPTFSHLARAAIFESGSAQTALMFNGTHRQIEWDNFVAAVPKCATAPAGDSFDCLRTADIATLVNAEAVAFAESEEEFPFVPVIDGYNGLIPELPSLIWASGNYAHIPFIAGTNLDEGTAFTPFTINSSTQIYDWIIANNTPSAVSEATLASIANQILELYPNNPALDSPFGTGNNTFGLSPEFKRAAAIVGDLYFQSLRRAWIQTASNSGVRTFGYIFTEPQTLIPSVYGTTHGTETPYTYNEVDELPSEAEQILSRNMIDYFISFVVNLNPNDNKGNVSRVQWSQYTPLNQFVIELNSESTQMVPDNYRQQQISFINQNGLALNH